MKNKKFVRVKSSKPVHAEVDGEQFNFNLELMIRKFSKKVKKSGVLRQYQENMSYEKPSVSERKKRTNRKKTYKKLHDEQQKTQFLNDKK